MKCHVVVVWFEMPCSDMVGYQRFGGPCSLCLECDFNWACSYCSYFVLDL